MLANPVNWSLEEEANRFEEMLNLYKQNKISEDEFRRFRLQHGTYSSRFQTKFNMVRVKIPSGEVNPEQLEKIAEICEAFSIGSAHVSTRENFQIHWVYLDDVPEVLRELSKVGLTTREACGNTIRNVTASPLAGVCLFEPFDVTPYAKGIAKFFLRNPLNQNLPRKFKINFSCCDKHGFARIGDIGLIPKLKEENGKKEKGFQIFFGGGLGPASFIGEPLEDFTLETDLLPSCIAIVRLFDRLGDREKMHRNRMRYLVHDLSPEKFREMIIKERRIVKATLPPSAKLELIESYYPDFKEEQKESEVIEDEDYQRWFLTNVLPQRQKGFYTVDTNLPAGDISAEQLRALAEICRKYSLERIVRLTPTQSILLRWIKESDLYELYRELSKHGLGNPGANSIAKCVGCSGTTSCNLAITNSHRLAKEIQAKLLALKLDLDEGLKTASIKISGCPNSCGQHEIATIGFYGGASRVNGALAPTYQMLLGGEAHGNKASLGVMLMRVPARRVIDVVLKVIELYKESKRDRERLDEWISRVIKNEGPEGIRNPDELRVKLESTATIPTIDKNPLFYVDWGGEEKFRAKTARGECAA
ncbi:MAG: nitrite/sulfite reductase [Nitrososphaerales archaeon]